MTGQQLKNSILQMAVQGKLVPQDPNDEPASVLLERIRKEKEQLIKDGKIKKEKNPSYIFRGADNLPYEKVGKNEPVCIADEVPFEIPESWEWAKIESISIPIGNKQNQILTKEILPIGKIPVVSQGKELIEGYCNDEEKKIDILPLVMFGDHTRNVKYVDFEFVIGADGTKFHKILLCNTEYIYYWMSYAAETLRNRGYARHYTLLKECFIPLPPIEEQERIVSKIKTILPFIEKYEHVENNRTLLNSSFPNLLKKSILQEAIQGKLVPQDPADEPASVLLERIRVEKERLIQEEKIKRDKHESVIYRRDNSHYEKLDGIERCIDDEIPFKIPETWCWCRLGNLIHSIDAGKSFKCNERPPEPNECGVIKVSAVTWGSFKQEESKTCFSRSQWIRDYAIQPGDFLICRANTSTLVGGCVIVEKISKKLMLSDKVLRLKFFNSVNKLYILHMLRSPFVRIQLSVAASGTSESMKNISQDTIKKLLIPFPPLEEQYRIVSKIVESLPKVMTL